MYAFRWNEWNVAHIGEHGVGPTDAEYVVNHPARGHPRKLGTGRHRSGRMKYIAKGQTPAHEYLQVIYVFDPHDTVYVIHARPLNDSEIRRLHRR